MTSVSLLAVLTFLLPAIGAGFALLAHDRDRADDVARVIAVLTAVAASALAVSALASPDRVVSTRLVIVDAAGGVLAGVVGLVGLAAVAASGAYLTATGRSARSYYPLLFAFWALLAAVPLASGLGSAWLVVEATTAASALLVGHSGRPRALEAGWKYLVLTTLGLSVSLLGIVVLEGSGVDGLGWIELRASIGRIEHGSAVLGAVLVLGGLAAKIGWAPVHNWLPDAHSEAPAPVSAMLSAALLPSVLLVAWRAANALAPAAPIAVSRLMIGFGLLSIAVAVPFLWRPMAWKRLLAYSSLEHMGVIALGIGFGTPLALAGAALHVVGHAVAKTLGFLAATPLLADQATAHGHAPVGLGRSRPALAAAVGVALAALAGLPPSPLFLSQLLVITGGFTSGHPVAALVGAGLLSLGFLGLAHAAIEALAGRARRTSETEPVGLRGVRRLTVVATLGLVSLAAVGLALPGSDLAVALARGIG